MFKPLLLVFATLSDPLPDYNRREWGYWRDADKDCQDTRQEVLIAESLEPVSFKSFAKCEVEKGLWEDHFTGRFFTNPSRLDIDHMVPLRNAHFSGGAHWTKDQKRKYSNYLGNPNHLIAVSASANRSKGARSPDQWLPVNPEYRCEYILDWIEVKSVWSLTLSETESWAIKYMLKLCDAGHIPVLTQRTR